ncbi:MAG: choice-of-anchor J domain-containing protein [Bacteroidales bacterium]|nr:choice-of-anchor J domain-containing protein [Bacteroidales bacterium]
MNKSAKLLVFLALAGIIFTGCVKQEFDQPEKQNIPEGTKITIAELRQMAIDSVTNVPGATKYRFEEDYSLYATVTMDEARSANLYKSVYVQDGTGAINLQLLYSGSLYEGDSIRIQLKGLSLLPYNGALQIDSVDIEKNIVKLATKRTVEPVSVSITDIMTGAYEATLVKIENVQFVEGEIGQTWAAFEVNTNRTIEDCDGQTIIVRTSGWSNFYGDTLPSGNGSMVAVASVYGSDLQVYVRSLEEVNMTANRCGESAGTTYLSKDFADNNVTSGGWVTKNVTGAVNWYIYEAAGDPCGAIKNYISGANQACETWLISPAVDLTSATNPYFKFRNACSYSGAEMEVFVSTNYDGTSAPSTATWTPLSYVLSAGFFAWADSGNIDFNAYKTSNVRVAFKYTGSSTDGRTWEVDDIKIKGE